MSIERIKLGEGLQEAVEDHLELLLLRNQNLVLSLHDSDDHFIRNCINNLVSESNINMNSARHYVLKNAFPFFEKENSPHFKKFEQLRFSLFRQSKLNFYRIESKIRDALKRKNFLKKVNDRIKKIEENYGKR